MHIYIVYSYINMYSTITLIHLVHCTHIHIHICSFFHICISIIYIYIYLYIYIYIYIYLGLDLYNIPLTYAYISSTLLYCMFIDACTCLYPFIYILISRIHFPIHTYPHTSLCKIYAHQYTHIHDHSIPSSPSYVKYK